MRKVKVVKQRDAKDCGACCLSSIILYYGGYVPMEKIRLDTLTNDEGVNALNMINAARKYGFNATGVKIDSLFDKKVFFPAIAHTINKNGYEHFVVIDRITINNVFIMDPAKGTIKMKINEFNQIWTNVLILFYPKVKIESFVKDKTLLKKFIEIFYREKNNIITIIIVGIILTLLTILGSYYFKIIIDLIVQHNDFKFVKIFIIFFLVITLFKVYFIMIKKNIEIYLNKNIDCILLSHFTKHILNLPIGVVRSRSSGEILTRLHDLINVKNLIVEIIISGLLDLFIMIISIPILCGINKILFFSLLIMTFIYILIGILFSKLIYRFAYNNLEKETILNSKILEDIEMVQSIKNLNEIENVLKKEENIISDYLYHTLKLSKLINIDNILKTFISELTLFLINSIGFYLFYKGTISLTSLITFNALLVYFLEPIKSIVISIPRYNFIRAGIDKINDFLSISTETMGINQKLKNGNICIKNLTFSYDNYNLILKNINFIINENEFILLKGKSGTGKSTLCKILLKYLTNYKGSILIGNKNIKDYSINTLRNNIVYVSQNENLFSGSIVDNILFYRDISVDKFDEICKICFINEIVENKPFRYETVINNDTSFISGGEKQRIILARSLLKEGNIYLFDEPLSEVDYNLEKKIIINLKRYLNNKTVIYITHKKMENLFPKVLEIIK